MGNKYHRLLYSKSKVQGTGEDIELYICWRVMWFFFLFLLWWVLIVLSTTLWCREVLFRAVFVVEREELCVSFFFDLNALANCNLTLLLHTTLDFYYGLKYSGHLPLGAFRFLVPAVFARVFNMQATLLLNRTSWIHLGYAFTQNEGVRAAWIGCLSICLNA